MNQRVFRFTIPLILVLSITLSVARSAQAILAEVTVPELVQMADHVVRAKVLGSTSDWNVDRTQILTTVTIQVHEVYSGKLVDSSVVSVICPGGIVDGLAMEVEHSPVFAANEDVIVFLTDIDTGLCRVSGWEAGKFTIRNGAISENGLSLSKFKSQIVAAVKSAGKR